MAQSLKVRINRYYAYSIVSEISVCYSWVILHPSGNYNVVIIHLEHS